MNTYLVDEAVLGQFADTLIGEKFKNSQPENYAELKKSLMAKTDHQILKGLIGSLTPEQGKKFEKLLDNDNTDSDTFDSFFKEQGIDLQEIIKNGMLKIRDDFYEGGQK